MATNNQRGLQVRGLRRSASGKQSSSFGGATEVARSGNNRDLFPSGGSNSTNNSTSRVIPQKPNLKYQQPQSFQNQPANYRDKVQIEGSSAFSSSRGNTGVISESKLQRSSSLSSSSSTQQDYKLEPSSSLPLKSKTLTPSSIFSPTNETSSRYSKHNEDVLNDILAPPVAIERAHTPSNSHHQSPTTFTHQQADKLNNSSQGRQSNHETIIIHVCDEARGVNRDFPCERKTLLAEMRYVHDIRLHCINLNYFVMLLLSSSSSSSLKCFKKQVLPSLFSE